MKGKVRANPMIEVVVILMIGYFAWFDAPGAVPEPPLATYEVPLPELLPPDAVAPEPAPEPVEEAVAVPEVEPVDRAVRDSPVPPSKGRLNTGN
jgi:hypothetical protein